jgi:hypothetical protein
MNYKEMDRRFYVSIEAARLLKEKGYNEQCEYCFYYDDYHNKWDIDSPYNLFDDDPMYYNNETIDDEMYSMPTKAEVIDWLEGKGMLVWAEPTCEDIWMWFIISPLHFEDNTETNNISYPTRLEAEEAAIIKALRLL